MEHAFGREPPFGLGIEEELLLVDPVTLRLTNRASELRERIGPVAGAVTNDVYEALIELSTPVVRSAAEGRDALAVLRETLCAAGGTPVGAGMHPDAPFGDVEHVAAPRYQAMRDAMRGLLERTPTAALHVHVGMPDADTAIDVFNRLRAHLPLLQALAAHSPYWHGRDSGLASARSMVFRAFPRAIVPPEFAGWDHYADFVARWEAAADVADYTYLWWDVRPSPRLGTVEVRAMDAQSRLDSAAGLAALVHALALACADGHEEPMLPAEALAESSFRAGRDGIDATVWWRGALRPIRDIGADALALARAYSDEDALDEVERILRDGGGADRMRAAHAAGGLDEVLAQLVAETYSSTQTMSPIDSQS